MIYNVLFKLALRMCFKREWGKIILNKRQKRVPCICAKQINTHSTKTQIENESEFRIITFKLLVKNLTHSEQYLSSTSQTLIKCTPKYAMIWTKGMYYKWSLIMIITKFKSIWYLHKQMSKSYMHWTHFAKIKETKGVLVATVTSYESH